MHKLIFCTQKVNRDMIRRENRKGVEHVVLASYTLPPNIVMNGGLYPEDEVNASFESLNRTPVTIEHPEIDGQYVSANDPEVDFDYRIGAFNENAQKMPDGRIKLDKVINVQKALKTDKGKRLLDRISQIESNSDSEPLHTSVGVFLEAEELAEPITEYNGLQLNSEAFWIGREMMFDHDAILLDNPGAATPDQGTGIGINSAKVNVEHVIIGDEESDSNVTDNTAPLNSIESCLEKAGVVIDDMGNIIIQASRVPVERAAEYTPKNQPREDNVMRDLIIAELEGMDISVNTDISDADLKAKYKETLLAANGSEDDVNKDLLDTIKAQADRIGQLEANEQSRKDVQDQAVIAKVKACSKYSHLSEASIKAIKTASQEDFNAMVAESTVAATIGSTSMQTNSADEGQYADIN